MQDKEGIAHEALPAVEAETLNAAPGKEEKREERGGGATTSSSLFGATGMVTGAGLATRANADLKRDVAEKLEMLEEKTRVAMVEMMKEAQAR